MLNCGTGCKNKCVREIAETVNIGLLNNLVARAVLGQPTEWNMYVVR
jgi:hypothetical protein